MIIDQGCYEMIKELEKRVEALEGQRVSGTPEFDGSAAIIFDILKSKMKSIVGEWNDFNLYVGTHDDLWHIAKVIERELKEPNA